MRPSFRNRVLFVEQNIVDADDPAVTELGSVQNLIFRTDKPELKWIELATERVGDWRSFVRSVYMRWAITINALHIARDRYAENPEIALTVDTLRSANGRTDRVHLAVWPAPQAVANYEASIPLIAAYAIQDLYGALEEIIFALWEIFLEAHPEDLMRGDEYRPLRRAHRHRDESEEASNTYRGMWSQRFEEWRRKRSYDGLHRVFKAFSAAAGLKRPSWYKHTDIDDWARTIETIGEIRHLIAHGEDRVSERLADLCAAQPQLGMKFTKGEQLNVRLLDLWIVEHFLDSLLNALNAGLMELGLGKTLPPPTTNKRPAAKEG